MDQKVAENPFKNRGSELNNKRENAFIVITALFVTLYVVSNVMAVKVIGLWNLFILMRVRSLSRLRICWVMC